MGGLNLIDIGAKCRSLLFHRIQEQQWNKTSFTAEWLQKWGIKLNDLNSPQIQRLPTNMGYLQNYAMDTAYITPRPETEARGTLDLRPA
jgi:hypothetical protein